MSKIDDFRREYASVVYTEIEKYAQSQGWDLGDAKVYVDGRDIKVDFGQKRHLIYVDQGTRPYLMTSLEGKVIPIGGSFRHVTGVGMPGMVHYERNGIEISQWKSQKWRHPGIKPRNFVTEAKRTADRQLRAKSTAIKAANVAGKIIDSFKEALDSIRGHYGN